MTESEGASASQLRQVGQHNRRTRGRFKTEKKESTQEPDSDSVSDHGSDSADDYDTKASICFQKMKLCQHQPQMEQCWLKELRPLRPISPSSMPSPKSWASTVVRHFNRRPHFHVSSVEAKTACFVTGVAKLALAKAIRGANAQVPLHTRKVTPAFAATSQRSAKASSHQLRSTCTRQANASLPEENLNQAEAGEKGASCALEER